MICFKDVYEDIKNELAARRASGAGLGEILYWLASQFTETDRAEYRRVMGNLAQAEGLWREWIRDFCEGE